MLVTVSVVVEVVAGAAATSWVTSRKSVVMIAKMFIFWRIYAPDLAQKGKRLPRGGLS